MDVFREGKLELLALKRDKIERERGGFMVWSK